MISYRSSICRSVVSRRVVLGFSKDRTGVNLAVEDFSSHTLFLDKMHMSRDW
jgi:hypothetical protein